MLKKHRNIVYDIVVQSGFNPNQFEVYQNNTLDIPSQDGKIARFIKYMMTTSIFEMEFQSVFKICLVSNKNIWFKIYSHKTNEGWFQCAYSEYDINYGRVSYPVNEKRRHDFKIDLERIGRTLAESYYYDYGLYFDFEHVKVYLSDWLKHVKSYISNSNASVDDDPDLWSQSEYASSFLGTDIIKRDDTSIFSDLEKEQIRRAVKDFRVLIISNYNPNSKQLTEIDKKLERLSNSLDRLDKFDWQGVAISTIIGIITTLTLDSEKGRQLWSLFLLALQQAHNLLPK